MKKKLVTKLKSYNKILITGFVVLLILLIFILFYRRYENTKPIGINDTIEVSKDIDKVKQGTNDILTYEGKTVNLDDEDVYLFEKQVRYKEDNLDKPEFTNTKRLTNNLLRLVESGTIEDINEASALWTRNQLNYKFTTKGNINLAGIGIDILTLNNFNEKTKTISVNNRGYYDKELAIHMREYFQSPIVLMVVGSRLHTTGQNQLFIEDDSEIINAYLYSNPVHIQTIQFKKGEPSTFSLNQEKLIQLQDKYRDRFNSFYEVNLISIEGIQSVGYVLEDVEGKLYPLGIYEIKEDKGDYTSEPYTLKKYRKDLEDGLVVEDTFDMSELNWNNFQDYLNN